MFLRYNIPISGQIVPYLPDENTFPTHSSEYELGGLHAVKTLEERDEIPEERRMIGMMCFVQETKRFYTLIDGIKDENWKDVSEFSFNGKYASIYVGTEEPENLNRSNVLWINPNTFEIKYKVAPNVQWEEIIVKTTAIDGGDFS